VLTPTGLQFTATGATFAQTVTASELNYAGTFTASSTNCQEIASISPATGKTFTVTPVGAGSCTFTFTDSGGQNTQLVVHVATTTIGGE